VFIFIFIAGVFSVPLLFAIKTLSLNIHFFTIFIIGLLSIIAVYYVANVQAELKKQSYFKLFLKFILLFPLFLALSMGLSLHNTIAVLQGYIGRESPFVRTPKFNIKGIRDTFKNQNYLASKISWTTIMEGFLSLYFFGGVLGGLYLQNSVFLVFHAMLAIGFGSICYYSIRHLSLK